MKTLCKHKFSLHTLQNRESIWALAINWASRFEDDKTRSGICWETLVDIYHILLFYVVCQWYLWLPAAFFSPSIHSCYFLCVYRGVCTCVCDHLEVSHSSDNIKTQSNKGKSKHRKLVPNGVWLFAVEELAQTKIICSTRRRHDLKEEEGFAAFYLQWLWRGTEDLWFALIIHYVFQTLI